MTKTRDWLTVPEHAKNEGVKPITIHSRIRRGKFCYPYDQTESGLILIYAPQKSKAQSQAISGKATCDRASNR